MIVVGLHGRIGSGKSTVAAMLGDRGAIVADADRIAHEVLRSPAVIDAIGKRHGLHVIDADGRVDRRKLAAEVFGPTPRHAEALAALEAIVHPLVAARIDEMLAEQRSRERAGGPPRIVVLDVPLLAASNLRSRCDRVLEVVCDEQVRQGRLAARGWDERERNARDDAWERHASPHGWPSAGRENSAAVDTSGDLIYTSAQVDRFLQRVASEGLEPRE
jgi:dephospho-CoA kinase